MLSVTGPADPALAWSRYAEIGRWSEWAPQIRGVERSAERLAPGVTGTVLGPAGLRIPFDVLSVDPVALIWRWRVRAGPFTFLLRHGLRAGPAAGSVATLTIRGPRLLALAYRPVAALALHRLLRA